MRITPLRGIGVAWFKCPACRLKCRPSAVGPEGTCPGCGQTQMLRLTFGGRHGRLDATAARPTGRD
ncbi:hypothetical protein AB0O76_17370 [Streptomyces sp. NPDC086554]|uniref:hypothetical protein n=1 Tax=Streptomyces sp. NPDC086554 TaxID=3154864 RepID=UPI00342171A5